MNEIIGKSTRSYSSLYPTDSIVRSTRDYSGIDLSLDENNGKLIIDFGADEDNSGATVAFDARDLRLFIAILRQAAKELNGIYKTEP